MPTLLQGAERQRLRAPGRGAGVKAGAPEAIAHPRGRRCSTSSRCWTSSRSRRDRAATPSEVAPVYFAPSERFGIDAMLTRVTRLPRDDRWDALARGALRDDLYAVLESLTSVGARTPATAGQTAAERIAQWAEDQRRVARAGPAPRSSGIERLENPGIAALSVALRTLRGGHPQRSRPRPEPERGRSRLGAG